MQKSGTGVRLEADPWRAPDPLTTTASLKQEDLGTAPQGPAVAQLLHQGLWLHFLPISPQQLALRPPMSHQGHKGTAHGAPAGVQPLLELGQLLLESLECKEIGPWVRATAFPVPGSLPGRLLQPHQPYLPPPASFRIRKEVLPTPAAKPGMEVTDMWLAL